MPHCSEDKCTKPIHCKFLCNTHYRRLLRRGDTNRTSVEERLDKYSELDYTTGCLLWVGDLDRSGYGRIKVEGKMQGAHRVSYMVHVGPIPVDMQIDHLCRVRNCINTAHLELVTTAENTRRGDAGRLEAMKTHCPQGHEYTEENTYRWKNQRHCRACRRSSTPSRVVSHTNGEINE